MDGDAVVVDLDLFLEADRLILTPYTMAEVDLLYELDSDPQVRRFINGGNRGLDLKSSTKYSEAAPRIRAVSLPWGLVDTREVERDRTDAQWAEGRGREAHTGVAER